MKTEFGGKHCCHFGSRWLYIWPFFAIYTIAQIESFLMERMMHDYTRRKSMLVGFFAGQFTLLWSNRERE
jgi:hypothetical protein